MEKGNGGWFRRERGVLCGGRLREESSGERGVVVFRLREKEKLPGGAAAGFERDRFRVRFFFVFFL
jgi:hypothetical protein